jgi:8-oxo-dGTP pyrophosphatase MutT (NUDIX family)
MTLLIGSIKNISMQTNTLFYIATKAILSYKGNLLMLYKNVEGSLVYDLPGGRVESFDPDLEENLIKELQEELGLSKKNYIIEKNLGFIITGKHWHSTSKQIEVGLGYYVFKVECMIEPVLSLSDEHERYEWLSRAKFITILKNDTKHKDIANLLE